MALSAFQRSCKMLRAAQDDKLADYYVVTPSVSNLAGFATGCGLAVGLKGVGKTAAYRHLSDFDRSTPDVTVGIDSDRYSLYLSDRNLKTDACRKQFKHDIILEALRAFSASPDSVKKKPDANLVKAAGKQVETYAALLKKAGARMQGFSISVLGCGFTLPTGASPVALGLRAEKDVDSALNTLKAICNSNVKIRIVIDDPENVFSATNKLDVPLVGGLCLAALELSQLIPNLKVIVLLKTHVYYPVLSRVDDLHDYPDHMARLSWDEESLVSAVDSRLKSSGTKWADVFSGGEQAGRSLVKAMSQNIRNGPRDLLRWIDLSLQSAAGNKISKDTIDKTRTKSSRHSLGELESAHADLYPEIGEVLKIVFRNKGDHKFTLSELKEHIKTLQNDQEMRAAWKIRWMQSVTASMLPDLLFKVGALALWMGTQITLPFEEGYHSANFESCSHVSLVPALIDALQ
jgi:hypothetical protein